MDRLDLVKTLSGKSNPQRRLIVEDYVLQNHLPYQAHAYGLQDNLNVVMDFNPAERKKLFLTAHYDRVAQSPGANDNASSVAVLLELAREVHLKGLTPPLTIIIFDQEEDLLKGSRAYVREKGVAEVGAVLNLEMVGQGSIPVFWEKLSQSEGCLRLLKEAALPSPAYFLPRIPRHGGDHLSFLEAGVWDSICFSLGHEKDGKLIRNVKGGLGKLFSSRSHRLIRALGESQTFKDYHKPTDDVDRINPASLQMAYDLVRKVVEGYNSN